ncbi:class I SAM-dependent DNA methyltransferase [Candidatus Chrysopegis kryptomonas]|uniref:Methyltransferase domain-containing protein n=1 Tax=Candidatus Chryseopegocella kryptomonas TaxID=1633643 RepID=A0A0P1MVQ3_9BACT|nr:class I SAM-dependent methyltransferase [Candidatus Chrysopegis kryptomonas]CUS99949.1 Methyltransferase domain-containing protein [Candidatus Chrysopegis kryptomonas]
MIQTEPYTALAEIYDFVMRDVPYKRWSKYITKLMKNFQPKAKRILDLACGTGTMILLLKKQGFEVDGVDSSAQMIEKAKMKVKSDDVKFFVSDMLDFKTDKKYDVALCLYDSVNYLPRIENFYKLFENVWGSLDDQGIFIFDISTEYNSIQNAILMNLSEKHRNFKYVRRSYYLRDERKHINEFEIEINGEKFFERHVQQIYKISEIEDAIKNSGCFEMLACFDDFSFVQASEFSERVHFVLKKKEKRNG